MTSSGDKEIDDLVAIRKKAEAVVQGMPEGPLKVAAFEKAFDRLGGNPNPPRPVTRRRRRRNTSSNGPLGSARKREGPKAHARELKEEGFFDQSQTAGEVVGQLLAAGHKYPGEAVSTALARLTRDKELKRRKEPRGDGGKSIWVYEKA